MYRPFAKRIKNDIINRKKWCRKLKKGFAVFLITILIGLTGCSAAGAGRQTDTLSVSRDLFAMDTYMTLTAYGEYAEEAIDAAEAEIRALDELLSTGNPDSEISLLNQTGSAEMSEISMALLDRSLEVYAMTGGAFNPLIYPLMDVWGFTDKDYRVPDEETIQRLLPLLDPNTIIIDQEAGTITFGTPDMMIDFGGIAKGYTSSRIMEIFAENGVSSGLVSLGGNVQVLGTKPDGSKYRVAIRNPEDDSAFLGIIETSDKAVITSGGYERFFEEDGVTYHHILNPETGYPANQGLLSVTVISSDGTLADGLSTALFVLGVEKGSEVWKAHPELFDVVFLTEDHQLYVSEGIRDDFHSQGYPVHEITRS